MRRSTALGVMVAALLPVLAAADQGELFVPSGAQADLRGPAPLGVVRARAVGVDFSALPGADGKSLLPVAGQSLVLNLFEDVSFVARLVRAERIDKGMSWVGRLEGQPLSNVVLVTYDGVLTGSVVWPEGAYRIAFDGSGSVVQQLDHDLFPEGDCVRDASPGVAELDVPPPAAADTGALVDVLVVYTPAARAAAGGTAGMTSLVNTAVTETNTGYANSGVVQRLRLAGTAELSYTEADAGTDLDRVTDTNDGYMDSVHALRDTYKADEVVLIGEGYAAGGTCGIAWLMQGNNPGFAPNAFAVVDRTCATGYYSFGHELGHNMGLNHAREDYAGTPTGAYPYSFGYKWTGYRTVMAYAPGTRILYFSNPSVQYLGNPTGVSESAGNSANNALSLNNTRVTVANWRVADTPTVTLTQPNGGQSWPVGSVQTVSWTSSALSSSATIKLTYTNGTSTYTIATGLARTATSYSWTIPNAPASNWRVTVCSSVSGACEASDSSDATFSITTPVTYALTVSRSGLGTGQVVSTPAGIDCGADCTQTYAANTAVTLTAIPDAGSAFSSWSGACTGAGSCSVTMDAAKSVTATFSTASLSISDVAVTEGNSGTTTATFTVSLSAASASTVTVNFATADGTATAPADYAAQTGNLSFTAGQTSKAIAVVVNGDTAVEPNETFLVNLTGPVGATLADAQGQGTITNDDTTAPPVGGEAVVWVNAVGVSVAADSITKTAPTAWGNAGAASSRGINGDGYVEVTLPATPGYAMFGLANGDTDQGWADIDFALYTYAGNGKLQIYEKGTYRGSFEAYAPGDKLKVAAESGVVKYYRNGTLLYTSTQAPILPLRADTSLYSTGTALLGATLAGTLVDVSSPTGEAVVWVSAVGVSVAAGSITKTAPTAWGNAGAASSRGINGDGYVEVTLPATPGYAMFGLANGDTDQGWADIDFALYTYAGNGKLQIYEKGTYCGSFEAYAPGDKLKVAAESGVVKYYRNGTLLYTSTQAPILPLRADTSLYSTGTALLGATLAGTLVDVSSPTGEAVVWVSAVGVSVAAGSITKTAPTAWGNAGAASSRGINGDGYVEVTLPATPGYAMFGLANGDTDQGWADIDFALYTYAGNGKLQIYEKGTYRGSFEAYAPGDKLKVAAESGVVKYYRNGTLLYTSTQAPILPLRADTSLYSTGTALLGATLAGTLVSVP